MSVTTSAFAPSRVREIGFADLAAVGALTRSVGLGTATAADWRRLWDENPACRAGDPPLPRGWVLEDTGRIAGVALCSAQDYDLGGRRLRAAVCGGLVVEPRARGSTLKLLTPWLQLEDVDLLLSTTNAPETARIFEFLKLSRLPQPGYDETLFWVTGAAGFLNAALVERGVPGLLARVSSWALSPPWRLEGALRRRGSHASARGGDLRVLHAHQVDASFGDLWHRKIREGRKLLACRTHSTLRWHFGRADRARPPFFVAAYSRGRLDGYAAVVRRDVPHRGLARARIADVLVANDDPVTTRRLLAAAIREAGRRGAHLVELVGLPPSLREVALSLRPFRRRSAHWPFHWRASDPALERELSSPAVWHASLFDGDGSL